MASSSSQIPLPLFEDANEVPANWSQLHESFFIELLLDKVLICGEDRQTGTFSKHDWTDIRKQYYMKFGLKHSLKSFKNKHTKLKEKYKDHKKLVEDNTGLGWDPVLCTEFPRNKVFRVSGCPEYTKLAQIFGDTVATGNLRQTQDGDFASTDEEDEINIPENPSHTPPLDGNTQGMDENVDNEIRGRSRTPFGSNRSTQVSTDREDTQRRDRSRTPIGSNRRGRKESKANEIGESLKMLAENAKAKLEDKTKYSISECLQILDSMGTRIGKNTYVKAVKVLQDKGWRETFIQMSTDRRTDWIDSIEDGNF
ncbi:hypothetical protein MKW94_004691 [Papaver nudicaule]|uniref:Myb/SANT-like domain-containing protein n=1 Tax=Papaver nudicaule TaxID=74823 RepID=A0AA41S4S2_PAPNU|nr:hypothetical protein [Papaver nudicaule]